MVIETAKRHNCLSQIVLRSSLSSFRFQEKVGSLPNEIIYIPVLVCKGKGDLEKLNDIINNYTIPIASFSFIRDDFEILKQIPLLKKKGYRIWLNSLWGKFNGGHDDELGFIDVSNSYEWLINSGANIIFSDNPLRLRDYLKNINKRKTL